MMNTIRKRVLTDFSALPEILEYHATHNPNKLALIFLEDGEKESARHTYKSLNEHSKAIARFLQNQNLQGKNVLLLFQPGLTFIESFFGCLFAGVIPVPAYPPRRNKNQEHIKLLVEDCNAQAVLSDQITYQVIQNHYSNESWSSNCINVEEISNDGSRFYKRIDYSSDQLAFLQYTSGSTGQPKGVMVSHRNILHNQAMIQKMFELSQSDVIMSWLPLYHDMGLIGNVFQPLFLGATCVFIPPTTFIRSPIIWLQAINKYKATTTGAPNFAFDYCVDKIKEEELRGVDLSSLRLCYSGAEPVRIGTINRFIDRFKKYGLKENCIFPCYGMAETTLLISGGNRAQKPKVLHVQSEKLEENFVEVTKKGNKATTFVSCGHTHNYLALLIVNPKTKLICKNNEIGEVWVKGDSITKGYWNKPELTKEMFGAFTADSGEGPFFRTGDLGFLHKGELYITGRLKDLIIIRGRNYYPQDIEFATEKAHNSIRTSGVAAFAYTINGQEELIVIAELKREAMRNFDGVTIIQQILNQISEQFFITAYDIIITSIGSVPKTTSGKVQRKKSKLLYKNNAFDQLEHLRGRPIGTNEKPDLSHISSEITQWIIKNLDLNPRFVKPNVPFSQFGIDSIKGIEFANEIQKRWGLEFDPTIIWNYSTIESLATFIGSQMSPDVAEEIKKETQKRIQISQNNHVQQDQIAIVGIAGRFPGADTLDQFWKNIVDQKQHIRQVPSSRWDWEQYKSFGDQVAEPMRWAGLIEGADHFDASFFNISPNEAKHMDPQHRLFLQTVWHTIEDAGYKISDLAGTDTGVFVGISSIDYLDLMHTNQIETSIYDNIGLSHAMVANRVSYLFNFKGPSRAIDTACSSSLVAINQAIESIKHGRCSTAIVGGVNLLLSPNVSLSLSKAGFLSPDGQCYTFDEKANGYVRAEGVAAMLIKPLHQAIEDNDNIYGTIIGTAENHGGLAHSLTAPNAPAQAELIQQAWSKANVLPQAIEYIETHGTGTKLGDPIEVQGLRLAINNLQKGGNKKHRIALGTAKSNIGHLEAAAGIAGVIKAMLAIKHNTIPANANFNELNQHIKLENTPFYIPEKTQPWGCANSKTPKRAAVSSFGFGGANAHVVLQSFHSNIEHKFEQQPIVFMLSAKNMERLHEYAIKYKDFFDKNKEVNLLNVSYTLTIGREQMDARLAFVCQTTTEAIQIIDQFISGKYDNCYVQNDVTNPADPKLEENVKEALKNKQYDRVAMLWTQGASIDWSLSYNKPKRISLPTYPFEKERHWIDLPETPLEIEKPVHQEKAETSINSEAELTESIKELAAELLGLEANKLTVDEDLSEYGFESLIGGQFINRMKDNFGIQIAPSVLLEHRTIKSLIKHMINNQMVAFKIDNPEYIHKPKQETFPLSFGQKGLWFIQHTNPESFAYNIPLAFKVESIDEQTLKNTIDILVERHQALRTNTYSVDHKPMQVVNAIQDLHINIDKGNLSSLSANHIIERIKQQVQVPFQLDKDPLMRVQLFDCGSYKILLFIFHHIIFDGGSLIIFFNEFCKIYSNLAQNKPLNLPQVSTFKAFVDYEITLLNSQQWEIHRQYWKNKLQGERVKVVFPKLHEGKNQQSEPNHFYQKSIKRTLFEKLKTYSQENKSTLFSTLFAALNLLIYRYTNQKDILIGTPTTNRPSISLESVIGYFVNLLPIRTQINYKETFEQFLKNIQYSISEALDHKDFPFSEMVSTTNQKLAYRDTSPILNIVFVFQSWIKFLNTDSQSLKLTPLHEIQQSFDGDLMFELIELQYELKLNIKYNPDQFNIAMVEALGAYYENILENILQDHNLRISQITLYSTNESNNLLNKFNQTTTPYPKDKTVHQLFEEQVVKTPNNHAVIFEGKKLTYEQLNETANQLAHLLVCKYNLQPEGIVGVIVERSEEWVIAILAILKAGGVYLPIDPSFPQKRIEWILNDAKPNIIVTNKKIPSFNGKIIHVPFLAMDKPRYSLCLPINSNHLCYIIYTSGSTGQPKGVMIQHSSFVNMIQAQIKGLQILAQDRCLQAASSSFDASLAELFIGLLSGSSTYIIPQVKVRNSEAFQEYIDKNEISIATIPPTLLGNLNIESVSKFRLIISAGDTIHAKDAKRISQHTSLINAYGPTEASVCVTFYQVNPNDDYSNIPIGKPIQNTQIYILDQHLNPQPIGVVGELYISGVGVARGYLNNPELTEEKFIENPFIEGERIYRSGDLARWLPDGNIEYIGRVDDQVKVRGYRIELGEIRHQLAKVDGISQSAVFVNKTKKSNQLVAFYVSNQIISSKQIREEIAKSLPIYMVPHFIIPIDRIPLNTSDKVDYKQLKGCLLEIENTPAAYEESLTPIQKKIVAIWRDILSSNSSFGLHKPFNEVGGDSILIIKAWAALKKEFNKEIPFEKVVANPTIEGWAGLVEIDQNSGTKETYLDLEEEIKSFNLRKAPKHDIITLIEVKNVLLTGVTGFVGAFLLNDLLQTNSNIYCLVRASNDKNALERIEKNLKQYNLWKPTFKSRIIALAGDLCQKNLGLNVDTFEQLKDDIDIIFHNGAALDFTKSYHDLKDPNVGGTKSILELATFNKIKPLHYVSTLSVFNEPTTIDENSSIENQKHHVIDGYAASKWVAEMLAQIAQQKGYPVSIYRLGRITGESENGQHNEQDLFYRMINTIIQTNSYPKEFHHYEFDLTPVDFVAHAIVNCAKQKEHRINHIINANMIQLYQLIDYLNEANNLVLKPISFQQWLTVIQEDENLPLYPLVPFLENMDLEKELAKCYHGIQTQNWLSKMGVTAKPSSELLKVYF